MRENPQEKIPTVIDEESVCLSWSWRVQVITLFCNQHGPGELRAPIHRTLPRQPTWVRYRYPLVPLS